MSEISKLIIPGNTIPYDLRDDYAREKINNNHLFIVSPLITGIVNAYTLLGRDVEPYEGLILHILCKNDNDNAIAPASIRLKENEQVIAINYSNSIRHDPINDKIYNFILHQVPADGTTPAYWNFYPMDDTLMSKGIEIIEQTTTASTAYLQVENALSQNILPVVHYIDTDNDNYEYWLPLQCYAADEQSYRFQTTTGVYSSQVVSLNVDLFSDSWNDPYETSTNTIPSVAAYKSLYYGTCDTAEATAAKVVTGVSDWSTPHAGRAIFIKFTNRNRVENPTLSINGSTAAPIIQYGSTPASMDVASGWSAGDIVLFIYDGTNWRFVKGMDTNDDTTYTLPKLGIGYAACSTTLATTAKTASLANYTLTTGGLIAIKFTYSVIANSTLNINSTGAKAIYYNGAAIQSNIIQSGDIALFVYNGTQYELLTTDCKNVLPVTETNYVSCTTAAATTTKTATLSGFSLPTAANPSGTRIVINFKYGVPANAKLNISSTGARNIICQNANITANTIQADDVVTIDSYWNAALTTPTAQYIVRAIDRNNIRHVYQNTLGIHNASTQDATGHIYESPTDIKGYLSATMAIGSATATNPTVYIYNHMDSFANVAPDIAGQQIGTAYIQNGAKEYMAPIICDSIIQTSPASLQTHLANLTIPANSTPSYKLQITCPKK